MNLTFEQIDIQSEEHFFIFKTINESSEERELWEITRDDKSKVTAYSINDFRDQFETKNEEDIAFLVKYNEKYIGYYSLFVNHPATMFKEGKVAWPSVLISQKENRNKGLGKIIFQHILSQALSIGCSHVEAGVFGFNQVMLNILKKADFKEIGVRENLTQYKGKRWDDPHYLKKII